MDENIISSLKLVYKPLVMYYGEWNLLDGLDKIALNEKGKNAYQVFLERYYYMPLRVIFKDDELVHSFRLGICSRVGNNGRNLFFSKKEFLRNIISNVEELASLNGEIAYKDIKKAIRIKKDMYRDAVANKESSPYFEELKNEYLACELDISLEEFILLCKKKYTRLLTGYNALLDFFDKPLLIDKFIKCFDVNQLYLFTMYSLLEQSKRHCELYGKIDYNTTCIENYREVVQKARKEDPFYNSCIVLEDNRNYTIDDFFKEYDCWLQLEGR